MPISRPPAVVDGVTLQIVSGVTSVKPSNMSMCLTGGTQTGAAANDFSNPMGGLQTAAATLNASAKWIVPRAGVLRRFRSMLRDDLLVATTLTVTVLVNGAPSTLSIVHPALASANSVLTDLTDDVAVAEGDVVSIRTTYTGVGSNGVGWVLEYASA